MSDQRRSPERETGRQPRTHEVPDLTTTADAERGSDNLATVPRAGNLSSDTRAGRPG